jgi:LPXTG-motif cell wall-anchored protein
MAAGMSAAGIAFLAGPASAHDLTGGSAQATCEGQTVQVTWNFVSENAGDNAIQSVTFNRAVSSSSFTASTVTAHTTEQPGTVSLTATVVFQDDYHSSHTVTTTIPDDVCPPPTTTTVPPTTVPPTTVPPTTTPVTTPPTTAPAPTTAPTVQDTVAAPAAVTPRQVTTTVPRTLPTTGSSSTIVIVAGLGALLVGGILLYAGRRGQA